MNHRRFTIAYLLPLTLLLAVGACSEKEETEPKATRAALLTGTNSWRLDETRFNGQVTGSGTTVKDRWVLHFVNSGTYHTTYLSDNSMNTGQWQLINQDATLSLVDHKGNPHQYTILELDNKALKLRWSERAGETHEEAYSAQ